MFLELIATFAAGFAAAGLVLIINKSLGGRLPRWSMPVAAGAAMIVAAISNEYGWYPRTQENMPPGFDIVETVESRAFYRPWTYVSPYVERFVAIDTGSVRTHPEQPDHRLADVYLFGRWSPISKLPVLADCAGLRRAALTDDITFEADGTVTGAAWVTASEDDAVLTGICEVG